MLQVDLLHGAEFYEVEAIDNGREHLPAHARLRALIPEPRQPGPFASAVKCALVASRRLVGFRIADFLIGVAGARGA